MKITIPILLLSALAGAQTMKVYQGSNVQYFDVSTVDSVKINDKQSQAIQFGTIGDKLLGTGTVNLSATSTSQLPVQFSVTTSAVCGISGTSLFLYTPGLCTVEAVQLGDWDWAAATKVSQSFNVSKQNQSITFPPLSNQSVKGTTIALTATASSGLPITYSTSTPGACSISGTSDLYVADTGACIVTAAQAGSSVYNAATSVSQGFVTVLQNQSITFPAISNQYLQAGNFPLAATASSGLAVSYTTTTPSVCTISSGKLNYLSPGTCTVTASQSGSMGYNPANSVTQSFNVVDQYPGCMAPGSNAVTACGFYGTTDAVGTTIRNYAGTVASYGTVLGNLYDAGLGSVYVYSSIISSSNSAWWAMGTSGGSGIDGTGRTISITYTATRPVRLKLTPKAGMGSCAGAEYYYLLGSASTPTTVQIPVNSSNFYQPSWAAGGCTRSFYGSSIGGFSFGNETVGTQTQTLTISNLTIQ